MKFIKFKASSKKIVHIKGEHTPTICTLYNGEFDEFDEIPSKHRLCGHCKNTYHRLYPDQKLIYKYKK